MPCFKAYYINCQLNNPHQPVLTDQMNSELVELAFSWTSKFMKQFHCFFSSICPTVTAALTSARRTNEVLGLVSGPGNKWHRHRWGLHCTASAVNGVTKQLRTIFCMITTPDFLSLMQISWNFFLLRSSASGRASFSTLRLVLGGLKWCAHLLRRQTFQVGGRYAAVNSLRPSPRSMKLLHCVDWVVYRKCKVSVIELNLLQQPPTVHCAANHHGWSSSSNSSKNQLPTIGKLILL